METIIRKRKIEDCASIANIVTRGWNETYKGMVPDYYLEELKNNEKKRANQMEQEFDENNNNNQLVLEVDGTVVGFCIYGKSEDEEINNCGEIFALYINSEHQGNGSGRKLVERAKENLRKMGFDKMIIACLKGNPSNEFYKHIGGIYIKDGLFKKLSLSENIYYYEI